MDPLSIVTSPVAVFQAVDRLARLVSVLEDFANASEDLTCLDREIVNFRAALDRVHYLASNGKPFPGLREIVTASLATVTRLERLIGDSAARRRNGKAKRGKAAIDSLVWIRKKRRVEIIKQQLRDGISAVQLEILSLNLISQINLSTAIENFGTAIEDRKANVRPTCSMSQHRCDETKPIHTPLTPQGLVLSIAENKTPNLSNGKAPVFNLGEDKEADAKTLITPHFISTSSAHVKAACSKSRLKFWTSWIAGFYCLLVFEDEQLSASNISHCSSLSSFVPRILSASFTLYTPWNPARPTFSINYQSSPYTSISLTFPRILPLDSEIFMYIRAGQLEKVKNLLLQGLASVLDIAAPFGLSTISLARSYKRMDIYNFLMIAGGNRCHSVPSDTSGAEQLEFWMKFGSQDYKMSAADILQDEIQLTVSISGVDQYNGDVQYPGVDYESLTRLHKCVLGLTIESLQSLLPELLCLDDVDLLGHTALHLATSKNDAKAIALLLNWGADSELKENTGKTPLHISATQDYDTCTTALLRYGANVQAKDHLGNTPLHHACKLGHLRTMKILIDHGADLKDCNYFGETPLTYANLGGHLAAVQLLQQHNADLTHRDKLGTTVVHDAIWFNSHEALEFYLKSSLRVDQKLQNGKSTLHLMAEEGDVATMQIFLEFAENGIEKLRTNDKDDRGCIAMQYLYCRRDVTELKPLFDLVLARVCNACHYSEDEEDHDVFWDAVEG